MSWFLLPGSGTACVPLFDAERLSQSTLVALLCRKARFQESRAQVLGQLNSDDARAQDQHVDVVMLHALMRGVAVMADPGADSRNLVGGYRSAYTASAEDDAAIAFAGEKALGYFLREVGIIDRRSATGARIFHRISVLTQEIDQGLLEFEAGVIGANGYAHVAFVASTSSFLQKLFRGGDHRGRGEPKAFQQILDRSRGPESLHADALACRSDVAAPAHRRSHLD